MASTVSYRIHTICTSRGKLLPVTLRWRENLKDLQKCAAHATPTRSLRFGPRWRQSCYLLYSSSFSEEFQNVKCYHASLIFLLFTCVTALAMRRTMEDRATDLLFWENLPKNIELGDYWLPLMLVKLWNNEDWNSIADYIGDCDVNTFGNYSSFAKSFCYRFYLDF